MTQYLKHPDAPDWDYFIWTPLLAERGDLVPFTPPAIVSPASEEIEPQKAEFRDTESKEVQVEPPVKAEKVQKVKKPAKGAKDGSKRIARNRKAAA